ncbi:unnamed protein product [Oikopleura dioica]|uniref:EF-hand domain-containing protein n=1 Tax=Oikopleura dioica TaxID=34765 RepID=E4XJS7_OIKDI|nr:unnamed protein product [Oikopleura dioica]CBY39556.1 unnamed protein product [Oikopleura dioica]
MGNKQSNLSRKKLKRISVKTDYSFAEIDHLYRGFRKDCPHGTIKKAEFMKIFANIFPNGEPEDFAQIVFNAYDRDRNGSIDFEEFICAMSLSRCNFERKLKWIFNLFDADGNGKVDKSEVQGVLLSISKINSKISEEQMIRNTQKMFAGIKNSEISFADFQKMAENDSGLFAMK